MEFNYIYKEYRESAKLEMKRRLCVNEYGHLDTVPFDKISDGLLDVSKVPSKYNLDKCLLYRYHDINDRKANYLNNQYVLIPYGEKNSIQPKCYDDNLPWTEHRGNSFGSCLLTAIGNTINPKWMPIFYDENSDIVSKFNINITWKPLIKSYIEHYKQYLGENWTFEEVVRMILELKYTSVQYARNTTTGEVMPVGFFGSAVRMGAGGKCFTNAELYVMPEFRGLGIAKELVSLTFEKGLKDNIKSFDSITYRVVGMDALSFWEKIGASISGLVHIEGDTEYMIEKINHNNSIISKSKSIK